VRSRWFTMGVKRTTCVTASVTNPPPLPKEGWTVNWESWEGEGHGYLLLFLTAVLPWEHLGTLICGFNPCRHDGMDMDTWQHWFLIVTWYVCTFHAAGYGAESDSANLDFARCPLAWNICTKLKLSSIWLKVVNQEMRWGFMTGNWSLIILC
jgi:hypothetical protein